MFGKNPVAKNEVTGDGTELRVVGSAPWYTMQGEGPFAGDPAVFIRLHGCPLRCFFCDTEFSNPDDPYVPVDDVIKAILDAAPPFCRLLVITGGEPVRQNLSVLISKMVDMNWIVQVETSGILWQECLKQAVIVCSPKTPVIQPMLYQWADAFKYVIQTGTNDPEDGLPVTNTQIEGGRPRRLARPRPGARVYLSPMDECNPEANARNQAEVASLAMKHGYRAGLQLHKVFGYP